MKNTIKMFGIIALVAVIGFAMIACSNPSSSGTSKTPEDQVIDQMKDLGIQVKSGIPQDQTVLNNVGLQSGEIDKIAADYDGWYEGSLYIFWFKRTKPDYDAKIAQLQTPAGGEWGQLVNYDMPDLGISQTKFERGGHYEAWVSYLSKPYKQPYNQGYIDFPAGYMEVIIRDVDKDD